MSKTMYYISNQLESFFAGAAYSYIFATGNIPDIRFNFKTENPSEPIEFAFYTKYAGTFRGRLLHPYILNDNLLYKPTMEVFSDSSFSTDDKYHWCSVMVSTLTDNKGSINLTLKPNALYGLVVDSASKSDEKFEMSLNWTEEV